MEDIYSNGILYTRITPNGELLPYTLQGVTNKYLDLKREHEKLKERWRNRIGDPTPAVFDPCFGICVILGCDADATEVDLMEHYYCESCAQKSKNEEPENWE